MTDECKFEIKEDTFSAKMPLISKQEYKQLNSNIEGFARAITKLVIVDKNMAIAQHIIRKQQEKIDQLEAERKEVIKKTEDKIEELEDILELCETDGKIAKYKMENLKEQISDLKEILEFMKGK